MLTPITEVEAYISIGICTYLIMLNLAGRFNFEREGYTGLLYISLLSILWPFTWCYTIYWLVDKFYIMLKDWKDKE